MIIVPPKANLDRPRFFETGLDWATKKTDSKKNKVSRAFVAFLRADDESLSHSECRNLLLDLCRKQFFVRRFPNLKKIRVSQGPEYFKGAVKDDDVVLLSISFPDGFSKFDVLKLLAHGLNPSQTGFHDRRFCRILLSFVYTMYDADSEKRLRELLYKQNVQISPRKTT